MNITNKDLELMIKIENLIGMRERLLFGGDLQQTVSDEDMEISHDDFLNYMALIEKLVVKREEIAKKSWESIKAKREIDKNYARSKK